jgi:hypothetical protein
MGVTCRSEIDAPPIHGRGCRARGIVIIFMVATMSAAKLLLNC